MHPIRKQRSDAVQNRERILAAAREVFTERGGRASLNEVAKRAGVGPGTLYRHFPSLPALLVAIVAGSVAELQARGRELLEDADPVGALRQWLRAFAEHASTMQGLLAAQLAIDLGSTEGAALADAHAVIVETGDQLLRRSVAAGGFPAGTRIKDVLRLITAIAWAGQQAPDDDPELVDRLFAIAVISPGQPC